MNKKKEKTGQISREIKKNKSNLLLSSIVKIQVNEGEFNPLSLYSNDLVIAEDIVRIHPRVSGRQQYSLRYTFTADDLTTCRFIMVRSSYCVTTWNEKRKKFDCGVSEMLRLT